MAQGDLPPVNRVVPPWARTLAGGGEAGLTPDAHLSIQHPNIGHDVRPAATPFAGTRGAGMAFAGRPRHHPTFSSPGGLARGPRK